MQNSDFLKKYNNLNFTDLHTSFDDLRSDLYSKKNVDLNELEVVSLLVEEWKMYEKLVQETNIMIAINQQGTETQMIMKNIKEIFSQSKKLGASVFLSFTPDDSID